jgi:hypothetical protein
VRLRSEAVTALAVILLCATGAVQPVLAGGSKALAPDGAGVASAPVPFNAPGGDDIILIDGRKITGTVVGMENGSFRVETDFGVALIRKDKVARIEVSKGSPAAPKPPEKAPDKPPDPPRDKAAVKTPPPPKPATIQERRPPGGHMEEHVEGGAYFNDSFGFQMYKPPNWKPLPETAGTIASAVAVLGTEDEATVMIVGTVLFDGPPSAYAAVLGASLKKVYSDFEIQPEEQIEVAGRPAIRRGFSGTAGGRVWHGMVVNLAEGQVHYGLIGLTSEENYQFKSSVLEKIVASFRLR